MKGTPMANKAEATEKIIIYLSESPVISFADYEKFIREEILPVTPTFDALNMLLVCQDRGRLDIDFDQQQIRFYTFR